MTLQLISIAIKPGLTPVTIRTFDNKPGASEIIFFVTRQVENGEFTGCRAAAICRVTFDMFTRA